MNVTSVEINIYATIIRIHKTEFNIYWHIFWFKNVMQRGVHLNKNYEKQL